MSASTVVSSGNAINLRRLVWLRIIVLLGEVAAVWMALSRYHMHLPIKPLSLVFVGVALISVLTFLRLQVKRPVSNGELFAHLTFEVWALTALLYLTGGSTNPFAPLYLLPLILTAAALPARYTWAMMVLTSACYSILLFVYVPLPEVHGSHGDGFRLHVLGMWLGFLLSASLIAGFAVRMAATVRRRDQEIAEMHEQQLRQERVLALATLAAGAAHDLGTPLATMAVLLKDIAPESALSAGKLDTLRQQVNRCKDILSSISAAAGEVRAESGTSLSLDSYLVELLDRWQVTRADVQLHRELAGVRPAPRIVIDQTLDQAIVNILNNAADASPEQVKVTAQWSEQELVLEVADRGPGLAADIAGKAGDSIVSTKQDGLGLGLFLTHTTLDRLGGQVRLFEREGGGVVCRIRLPLAMIRVGAEHE
jgi:two-component system sensor histidine kinase RegB